jgi:hypothetical protein
VGQAGCGYRGTKGKHTTAHLKAKGIPNNWASSCVIPDGWQVMIASTPGKPRPLVDPRSGWRCGTLVTWTRGKKKPGSVESDGPLE